MNAAWYPFALIAIGAILFHYKNLEDKSIHKKQKPSS